MARQKIVVYKDDLDGSEVEVKPTTFAFDGSAYEIDLSPDNHKRLTSLLEPFIAAATKVAGRKQPQTRVTLARRSAAIVDQRTFNARVRQWASANGHAVKPRGRVPDKTVDAYLQAGGK